MLENLTVAQEALLGTVRDEWIEIGLSTGPTDRKAAEEAVKLAYRCAGLEPPKDIYWCRSPLSGVQKAAELATAGGGVTKQELVNQISCAVYGQHDAGWLSFYDYFRRIGLKNLEAVVGLIAAAKELGWFWVFSDCAVLTEKPIKLVTDDDRRLHCETGPALEYGDGFCLYCWHGVCVDEQIVMRPETITTDMVVAEENQEVKRVMLERYGWGRLLEELEAELLDESDFGKLYQTTRLSFYLTREDPVARFVQVRDASTAREYWLRVPPTVTSAKEAVAWTFDEIEESYHPDQQT